ncbi:MAG: Hsp20/alpha crystallin family protein [Planctomycetaceae bacterium]|nr:Hsp20/alpha crystallin family protein [Planctomycetaceae bacterium]
MAGQLTRKSSALRPWFERSPLASLRQEMDELFSRFIGEDGESAAGRLMAPSLDLSETDDEIEVRMDVPGFKPDEIDVALNRDLLTLSGEHSEEKEDKEEERRYHRIERRRGSFRRIVQLPASVQEDGIEASFEDGVLTIRMPKAEQSKPHRIPIKG